MENRLADNECKPMFYPARRYGPCVELSESESRAGDTETYVFEHLMPVKVEDSNNKNWYWMKYIAEGIDFWTCNDDYKELYDRQVFQETIDRVLAEIAGRLGY
jgi:hypothetical protein